MENKENKTDIFTVNGKEFDISTPEGKAHLKGYLEATSQVASKKANENFQIKKTLGVSKDATVEDIRARLASARADGDTDQVDALTQELIEYPLKKLENAELKAIEDSWFEEYKNSRPEIFENIPANVAKDALFGKYGQELHHHDDPVGFADQILNSYIEPIVPVTSPVTRSVKKEETPKKTSEEKNLASLLSDDPFFKG